MPGRLFRSRDEVAIGGDPVNLMRSSPFPLGGENDAAGALC